MSSDTQEFSPPYIPFRTLQSAVERMSNEGLPARLDRSYLSNLPWSSQNHFLAACRSFGLIDADGKPTQLLIRLVEEKDNRPAIIAEILRTHYAGPLSLGDNATQEQLDEQFKEFNLSGSTLRKAVAFYMHAAKFAGISLSPHFRAPRTTERSSSTARKKQKTKDEEEEKPPPPPPDPYAGLHPFLQGLLRELPDDDTWTSAKREKWLQMAELTVDMLYTVEGGKE